MDSQYINLWTFCRENLFSCTNFSDYTKISWSILLIGGFFAYFILRKSTTRKWIIQHLMRCAILIFISGLSLYIIGFSHEGTGSVSLSVSEASSFKPVDLR